MLLRLCWQLTATLYISILAPALCAEDIVESIPDAAYLARVSIIIDDLGYGLKPGQMLAESPFDLTLAIIPFTPYGNRIARLAFVNRKEVMLHAPMEPLSKRKWEAGLTVAMGEFELVENMAKMLHDIPYVQGVNNHGGSRLTQDHDRMAWMMSFLAQKQLYFIDSRTTANSQAEEAAKWAKVAHSRRDIFLDNQKSSIMIRQQIDKLRALALKRGVAIAIGHPYPETLAALDEALPKFAEQGVEIVPVSKLIFTKHTAPTVLLATP